MIKVKLENWAFLPEKAHRTDAGFDIRTPYNVYIPPHGSVVIDTGIHVAIPYGYVGMIKSKSGLNVKYNLTTEGVVDAGYTGSVMVKIYNHGSNDYFFNKGDKLTQMVILPIHPFDEMEEVDELPDTDRGKGGFGSTGR